MNSHLGKVSGLTALILVSDIVLVLEFREVQGLIKFTVFIVRLAIQINWKSPVRILDNYLVLISDVGVVKVYHTEIVRRLSILGYLLCPLLLSYLHLVLFE